MRDLIERLEQATEGSRELDNSIDVVVRGNPDWKRAKDSPLVPHYTTSLDAALTLVPEGYGGIIGIGKGGVTWLWREQKDKGIRMGTKGPPALALCIASLRAWKME